MDVIEGRLVRGLGQAGDFTQLDWVRRQLIETAGIDPHPGTVNLEIADGPNREIWRQWRRLPGYPVEPAAGFCSARCYPVQIEGRVPAAVIVPDVDGYPEDKLEFVCALPLRRHLALEEGAPVKVTLCGPMVARAVLFDIDGTMVDSVSAYLEVARIAAEPYGLEVTEQHVRYSLAIGDNFWKGVVPPDHEDGDALRQALSAHAAREWPRVLREQARVFSGLIDTLDTLKERGIALGIVSGARSEVLNLLRDEGVLERFDSVLLGSDVSKRKPDPEGIFKCLNALGIAPEAAVYVGDTAVDVQASQAAGVRSVGVLSGAGDSALMSAFGADRLVTSHAKLPAIIEAE